MGAFLGIIIALGALAGQLEEGLFVSHALAAASHHIGGAAGGVIDVFCF